MTTLTRIGSPCFGIAIRCGRGRVRLLLRGELDLAGVGPLDQITALVAHADLPFTLDCRALTFIDAAGVGALVGAVHRGGTLDGVHGAVLRVLDVLDLRDLITRGDHGIDEVRRAS